MRGDARLYGRSVRLRAIDPTDYARLRQAETASPISLRWRLNGQSVPPEHYASSLWNGVLAAFIFESLAPSSGCGVVSAYGADPRHGFAHLAAGTLESFGGPVRDALCSAEAVALFVDFVFTGWNFRKIYIDVAAFNAPQFGSFLERCEMEGRLKDHLYLDGEYWDLVTYALWRDQWSTLGPLLRREHAQLAQVEE